MISRSCVIVKQKVASLSVIPVKELRNATAKTRDESLRVKRSTCRRENIAEYNSCDKTL